MKPPEELEQCIEKNVKSQSKEAELIISATVVIKGKKATENIVVFVCPSP